MAISPRIETQRYMSSRYCTEGLKDAQKKKWTERFNNYDMAKYVLSYGRDLNGEYNNAENIFSFITTFFNNNGFSTLEATEYMMNNKLLFRLDFDYLVGILSILDIIKLGKEALFEHSKFILELHSLQSVYSVVNNLKSDTNPSMDKIIININSKDSGNVKKPLTETRKQLLQRNYMTNVINKSKESCKTM